MNLTLMSIVLISKMISNYKIFEKLGESRIGTGFKAENTKIDRIVALIFLASGLLTTTGYKKVRKLMIVIKTQEM
jgi:hypothetical protein